MSVMPLDQAAGLRRLMEARVDAPLARPLRAARARVVAIASGKGGVGKTNIAVNLALCLARRGRQVVLVDADLGTANADIVLNVHSPYDLSHVLRGERSIDEIAVTIESGLRLVAGASGLGAAADLSALDRQDLVDELGRLERQADYLLLDCGAGISQNVLAFAQAADELLVITTPEPTALTDAYALVKVLSRLPRMPVVGIIVNQAANLSEATIIADRLASVAGRFLNVSLTASGQILRDPHVGQAVRLRTPFLSRYPRCPASACIAALAERIDRAAAAPAGRDGFFRRVLGSFY